MSYQAEQKYEVVIADLEHMRSSKKGTLGVTFLLTSKDGNLWHTAYHGDNFAKTLGEFGFSNDEIRDPAFMARLRSEMVGKTAYITTELDTYFPGKPKVKVRYFNGKKYEKKAQELPPSFFDEIATIYKDLEPMPF